MMQNNNHNQSLMPVDYYP